MPGSSPTPFPPEGERYGRFVLLERIGRGGMAEVFRACAQGVEGFQRVFVVKRIQREQSDNPQLVDMFANEARISALLNHPNIVQVFDFGQLDGSYFISMEYLRGKDLLAVLRQLRAASRYLSPSLMAMIAREVATGLAYAHNLIAPGGKSLDIIHRDVSPSNIMLLRAGGVKLLDFGIAKASAALLESGRGHTTGTGMLKGKLSYLSPEQVRHEPVDARSDIFSLGVVMWEGLTGKRLFHDRSDYHTMNNVLQRQIPAPSTQQPDVPAALDAIVLGALERDRNKRIPSAKVLADELDQFLVANPVAPRAMPRLLDELFGADGHELEAMPAVGSGALAADDQTPVMTAVMLPTMPSIPAISAIPAASPVVAGGTPTRSDGLLPASSPSGERSVTTTGGAARLWPWVAGGVLVIAAFTAGRLFRPAADPKPHATVPGVHLHKAAAQAVAVPPSAPSHAEPEKALPPTISMRLESDPPGADVFGPGGETLGQTPLSLDLPRGRDPQWFTVSKSGFAPHRQAVTPDRDVAATVNLRATNTRAARSAGKSAEARANLRPAGNKASSPSETPAASAPGKEASGKEGGKEAPVVETAAKAAVAAEPEASRPSPAAPAAAATPAPAAVTPPPVAPPATDPPSRTP